jgi:hypothetical protein
MLSKADDLPGPSYLHRHISHGRSQLHFLPWPVPFRRALSLGEKLSVSRLPAAISSVSQLEVRASVVAPSAERYPATSLA